MLPNEYYQALHVGGRGSDKEYIEEQLARISFKQREAACIAYSEIFATNGRSIANSRLRGFADRCEKVNSGHTNRY